MIRRAMMVGAGLALSATLCFAIVHTPSLNPRVQVNTSAAVAAVTDLVNEAAIIDNS